MIGESTERERRLQEKLAANVQRVRRKETAETLAKVGGMVAGACDRFTIHHGDPGLRFIEHWIRRNGNGYSGRKPDVVIPIDLNDIVRPVRELARQYGLEGWCALFLNYPFGWTIGLDVSEVHGLSDILFPSDDILLASKVDRWCVNIHHEGNLWLWRDIDWQAD